MTHLSPDQVAEYRRDGVIHIRSAVGPELVDRMTEAVDGAIADPSRRGGNITDPGKPGMVFQDRHLFPTRPEFERLLHDTDLAHIAAEATGSSAIRVYFDHVFVKDPGTQEQFGWQQDRPYWAVDGTQVCSTWVALTRADAASSALEFVVGSHRWGRDFKPEFPALEGKAPEEVERALWEGVAEHIESFDDVCPAFEDHPDLYEIRSFAVEPGDALLFDFRTVHRSGPNSGAVRRAAISWRWLGDDAFWAPKPGADPIIGPDDTYLQPGDLIADDDVFPMVHPPAACTLGIGLVCRRPVSGPEVREIDAGPSGGKHQLTTALLRHDAPAKLVANDRGGHGVAGHLDHGIADLFDRLVIDTGRRPMGAVPKVAPDRSTQPGVRCL